jgi:hypothetical protein
MLYNMQTTEHSMLRAAWMPKGDPRVQPARDRPAVHVQEAAVGVGAGLSGHAIALC